MVTPARGDAESSCVMRRWWAEAQKGLQQCVPDPGLCITPLSQAAPAPSTEKGKMGTGNVPLLFLSSYWEHLCPWKYRLQWAGTPCNHWFTGARFSLTTWLSKVTEPQPWQAHPRSGCWQCNLLCFYLWQPFSRTNYFCIFRWSDIKISQSMAWLH